MQVTYFVRSIKHIHSGVSKKIIAQVASLNEVGVNTKILTFGNLDELESYAKISDYRIHDLSADCNYGTSAVGLLRRDLCINRALRCLFKSLGPRDVVYSRIPPLSISTLVSLRMPRDCKVVLEFQSIGYQEAQLKGHYLFALLESMFGKIRRTNIDGIVGVTDEITAYELEKLGDTSIPHITIGNGFKVNSVVRRCAPEMSTKGLDLLCVATNFSRWHGFDRLLRGLAAHDGVPKVTLHIAGSGAELPHLQQLTNDLSINDRVVFHGFTTGKAYDALFDQCHIAVGSLGIHRIGLKEASVLKVRDYCARGIPFIYSISDPDFPSDFPYILRLPADESPINIEQVLAFARKVCVDPSHSEKMRRYAEEHLDWSVKMKKLKGFLEVLVEEEENDDSSLSAPD